MDTHDAHNVRVFVLQRRFAVIHLILFQLLHIAQEMIQSEVARFLVIRRLHQQHLHIGAPPAPLRLYRHIIQVIRLPQYHLQKLLHRQIDRHAPKTFHMRQKLLRFAYKLRRQRMGLLLPLPRTLFAGRPVVRPLRRAVRTCPQRIIQIFRLRKSCTDQRDLLFLKTAQIRMQHPIKRYILQRVIQDPQKMQQFLYFPRCEIACP